MYFFGINSDRLVAKGQKNKWHVGTTHGFAGFGLSKTVYFSGGEKKKFTAFCNCSTRAAELPWDRRKAIQNCSRTNPGCTSGRFWLLASCWNGTESGPSSEFTETFSAIFFFFCTLDWFVLSAWSFGGGPCVCISHAWCCSELNPQGVKWQLLILLKMSISLNDQFKLTFKCTFLSTLKHFSLLFCLNILLLFSYKSNLSIGTVKNDRML